MYQFVLDIGDYSYDGHGRNETFIVEADKPVEAARSAHILIPMQTGIDLSSFCNDLDDHILPETIYERMCALGFEFPPLSIEEGRRYMEGADSGEDMPFLMAKMWVFLLNIVDPMLNARIIPKPTEPPHLLICGAGFPSVGYGLV